MPTTRKPKPIPLSGTHFLEGPAGTGKTTEAADYLSRLLKSGVAPERILVLVPQRTLARVYQQAAYDSGAAGGIVPAATIARLAFDSLTRYWPLVASKSGFSDPTREPTFLTIETAQYFMARIANPSYAAGNFDGISVSPARVISQTIDNLTKAALLDSSIDSVTDRLVAAWGDRSSAHAAAYRSSADIARAFRAYCLEHNLIDVSLALELFNTRLRPDLSFQTLTFHQYTHLIADNVEEDNPSAHDFIAWLLPHLEGALVVYDTDAGYRSFLGAEPDNAYNLSRLCEKVVPRNQSRVTSRPMQDLIGEFDRLLGPVFPTDEEVNPESVSPSSLVAPDHLTSNADGNAASNTEGKKKASKPKRPRSGPLAAFDYETHTFFPQMVEWAVRTVQALVKKKVSKREIVLVAPFLSDSLRFSLVYPLREAGIETLTHRPSRALRDEPSARAMITLARLAYAEPIDLPAPADVADAMGQAIEGLDPVRARLLVSATYGAGRLDLRPFDQIKPEIQTRISYRLGERYDTLRQWLSAQRTISEPLDYFWRRLFGELLSQPSFGFHRNMEAGRLAAQLIDSANTFRATLYADSPEDWTDARREYFGLIEQGLLAALAPQSWQDENADAVFIAPAVTFLLRNRVVDHQLWLDVGNPSWSGRMEQPLTHPYVLRREFQDGTVWTDDMEHDVRRDYLHRLIVGLARRCRKQIHLGIADLGEEGNEQRGGLLDVFQRIAQRNAIGDG